MRIKITPIKILKIKIGILIISFLIINPIYSQDKAYKTISNISYHPQQKSIPDAYIKKRCVLDIYYPIRVKNFPTLVWFHGGGLTSGKKYIPEVLKNKGLCIIPVNYRLHPKVKHPKYIEDAAAAVAWVYKNIKKYGGNPSQIFVSGHSAGGYLANMVGIDPSWLQDYELNPNVLAGIIPLSGHTITHFTIRKELGIPGTQPIIDKFAPLYHVRADAPPFFLLTGDRKLELLGRYEENAYFVRMMKVAGHKNIHLQELKGYGHDMTAPAFPLLLAYIKKRLNATTPKKNS